MRRHILRNLAFVLTIALITPCALVAQTDDGPTVESEDATFLYAMQIQFGPYNITRESYLRGVRRYNQNAKPRIYRFIDETEDKQKRSHAIGFLGHIGDSSDVERILNILRGFHGEIDDIYDEYAVFDSILAISIMSYRGIDEATRELDRMLHPDYWKQFDFTIDSAAVRAAYHDPYTQLAVFALNDKSYTLDPKFQDKAQAVLASLHDPDQARIFGKQLTSAMKTYDKQQIAQGNIESLWRAEERQRLGFTTEESGAPAVRPKPRRPAKSQYFRMFQAREARVDLAAAPAVTVLQAEAVEAFNGVGVALRRDDWAYIVQHLADDGRPVLLADEVSSASVKTFLENAEMMNALGDQKKLLAEVTLSLTDDAPVGTHGYRFAASLGAGGAGGAAGGTATAANAGAMEASTSTATAAAATDATSAAPALQNPKESFDVIVVHLEVGKLQYLKTQSPQFFKNSVTPFPETLAGPAPISAKIIWALLPPFPRSGSCGGVEARAIAARWRPNL